MNFFRKYPLFLFLLPLFFVFHGFVEHYPSVPLKNAFFLVLVYLAAGTLIMGIIFWFFKDFQKAAMVAFVFLAFNFFFGNIQDLLEKHFEGTFFVRYLFILPLCFILIFLMIVWVKNKKAPFHKSIVYLNVLFLLLLVMDVVRLSWILTEPVPLKSNALLTGSACDTCSRPDIYLIILDGYSGNTALRKKFGFDNSSFENELRRKGFYVAANSFSNYNYTPFSLASMLNMTYLDLNMKTKGPGNLNYAYSMIRENSVIGFLDQNNYEIHNYSIFDLKDRQAIHSDDFISTGTKLITSQTFLSRVWKDILFNINTGIWHSRFLQKRITYSHLHNNNEFISLTLNAAKTKERSKFVYTHLMMPHYPYYFNSKGSPLPLDSLVEGKQYSKRNYVEYLQYCNSRIIEMCDSIFKLSAAPPVIILAGDHGFRYFQEPDARQYYFNNLCAVHLPSGNYSGFYDSISLVNLFPVILNTQFQQRFPVKKDSTIFLWE